MQILHALAEFDWSTESCYSVWGGGDKEESLKHYAYGMISHCLRAVSFFFTFNMFPLFSFYLYRFKCYLVSAYVYNQV